jgi:hypothetical protein
MAAAFEAEEPDFDNTDRSLEEMGDGPEGQHMPEDEEVEEAAAPEGDEPPKKPAEPEEEPADEPGDEPEEQTEPEEPRDARGLRAAMLSERKQRQAAEAATKAAREEIAAERARIDRLLLQPPQQQQPQQVRPPEPDPVLDPDGYRQHLKAEMQQQYTMRRIEETFQETHEELGKEFVDAYESLRKLDATNPVDQAIGNRIYTSYNPGKALMKWHREQTLIREVGNDPAAYRQKLRDELLNDPDMVKAVLARVREQRDGNGQQPGAPRNITRLPPSLNRARGGSTSNELLGAADNTDEAIFNYAMNGNG